MERITGTLVTDTAEHANRLCVAPPCERLDGLVGRLGGEMLQRVEGVLPHELGVEQVERQQNRLDLTPGLVEPDRVPLRRKVPPVARCQHVVEPPASELFTHRQVIEHLCVVECRREHLDPLEQCRNRGRVLVRVEAGGFDRVGDVREPGCDRLTVRRVDTQRRLECLVGPCHEPLDGSHHVREPLLGPLGRRDRLPVVGEFLDDGLRGRGAGLTVPVGPVTSLGGRLLGVPVAVAHSYGSVGSHKRRFPRSWPPRQNG